MIRNTPPVNTTPAPQASRAPLPEAAVPPAGTPAAPTVALQPPGAPRIDKQESRLTSTTYKVAVRLFD